MKIRHNTPNIATEDIKYKKQMSSNVSFGCESITRAEIVNDAAKRFGKVTSEEFGKIIDKLTSSKKKNRYIGFNSDGSLNIKTSDVRSNLRDVVIDPIIHMPIDLLNSSLEGLRKFSVFKNSKAVNKLYDSKILSGRRETLQNFSDTMAVKGYVRLFKDEDEIKNIVRDGQRRFNPEIGKYNTNVERTVTRVVTGVVPAFFLANDAYNLSMYMNNNKETAGKEKKRRFNQEAARIALTAASTFAVLGLFNKKGSASSTTLCLVLTTIGSEIIGRVIAGTPFYPIGKRGAKKYAELQNKKKKDEASKTHSNVNANKIDFNKSQNDYVKTDKNVKDKKSSDTILKLLGAMVLIGAGWEYLPKKIKPVKDLFRNIKVNYREMLSQDMPIEQSKLTHMIDDLRDKGFSGLADQYQKTMEKIKAEGNLTLKERNQVDKRIDEIIDSEIINGSFVPKGYDKKVAEVKEKRYGEIRKQALKELGFPKEGRDNTLLNICTADKVGKNIVVDQIIGLPFKFAAAVIKMPFEYVIKPAYQMPINAFKRTKEAWDDAKDLGLTDKISAIKTYIKEHPNSKPPKGKTSPRTPEQNLLNVYNYYAKHEKDVDFASKFNRNLIEAFDTVNKSSIANAELSGPLKTAVSTATSAFLVLDNYNMVMIDSQGDDKKLANQKAKERTIQRIVRIAYGACLINMFNSIFSKTYSGSLLGAELVNVAQTGATEVLERTSVGLPLHSATREEIIEKDNNNLNATGLKGHYYRFMSKLTGKKSISQKSN